MSVAKTNIQLEWKDHNVDLAALDVWMRENIQHYCGNTADTKLTLWFDEIPSEEDIDAAKAKWDEIDSEHDMALSYVPMSDVVSAKADAKASALGKLAALGLSELEIKALLG